MQVSLLGGPHLNCLLHKRFMKPTLAIEIPDTCKGLRFMSLLTSCVWRCSDHLSRMDPVPIATRVHRGQTQPPVSGHTGAQAGPGRLAVNQLRLFHGEPAGAPVEHLPGERRAQCLPPAAHAVSHQPQGQGMSALSVCVFLNPVGNSVRSGFLQPLMLLVISLRSISTITVCPAWKPPKQLP